MEISKMTLLRDGQPNLRFRGAKIADVSSHSYRGDRQDRWTEIGIYRKVGGQYVVEILGRTIWQGESDRHSAYVCADGAAVIAALTQDHGCDGEYLSALARDALAEAGIECAEDVE